MLAFYSIFELTLAKAISFSYCKVSNKWLYSLQLQMALIHSFDGVLVMEFNEIADFFACCFVRNKNLKLTFDELQEGKANGKRYFIKLKDALQQESKILNYFWKTKGSPLALSQNLSYSQLSDKQVVLGVYKNQAGVAFRNEGILAAAKCYCNYKKVNLYINIATPYFADLIFFL